MPEIAGKILKRLRDPQWVRQGVAKARKATGGPNACAATLSVLLQELGLIDKLYTWTAQLVGTETKTSLLEERYPIERILHPAQVHAGDILASRDRAEDDNTAPDHVYVAVGNPQGSDTDNPFALVVDNYCRNGRPYWRNLGRSGWYANGWRKKTPMAYALRFVEPPTVSPDVTAARQDIVNHLPKLYQLAPMAELSPQTMHHLNALRWSVELGDVEVDSSAAD